MIGVKSSYGSKQSSEVVIPSYKQMQMYPWAGQEYSENFGAGWGYPHIYIYTYTDGGPSSKPAIHSASLQHKP